MNILVSLVIDVNTSYFLIVMLRTCKYLLHWKLQEIKWGSNYWPSNIVYKVDQPLGTISFIFTFVNVDSLLNWIIDWYFPLKWKKWQTKVHQTTHPLPQDAQGKCSYKENSLNRRLLYIHSVIVYVSNMLCHNKYYIHF